MLTIVYELYTEEDEPEKVSIPAHYEVCERCRGTGVHVNPSIDGHGLSQEDFDNDPDFKEAYFSGAYDVTCYECKGLRVVLYPNDPATFTDEQKAKWALLLDQWVQEAADRREAEMERRMGA
jgi:hypothetical protein